MQQIHAEHQRLSGDGFTAWAVYPRCKGQSDSYIEGCFGHSQNEVMPYTPRPGVQQPTKAYAESRREPSETTKTKAKIYERCELAQELRFKHKIPIEQVATWVCIAKHESDFNTAAIGRLNLDGSEDHGLFQISDIYWCSPPGTGTACGVECSKFEDSDISDDVACMAKIFDEHQLLSGDGFNAWAVYRPHCLGRAQSYIEGCFKEDKPQPAVTQPQKTAYRPVTTKQSFYDTKTLIDTTIRTSKTAKNWQTTQKVAKTSPVKMTVVKTAEKLPVTTQQSVSSFDTYFNNVARRPTNNDINPQQKRVTFKQPATTKSPITWRLLNEVKLNNNQPATRRTTLGNPSSSLKSSPVTPATKSTLTNARTTVRTTLKDQKVLQSHAPTPLKRTAATPKPFDLFSFYLNGYTTKAIPYQPVQFSDRSTVIIKKAETSNRPTSSSTYNAAKNNPITTTAKSQKIRKEPTTVRPLSVYNAFNDYSVKSNRIGRLVPNVTPHSIDYLLKLTTPRPAFKRS